MAAHCRIRKGGWLCSADPFTLANPADDSRASSSSQGSLKLRPGSYLARNAARSWVASLPRVRLLWCCLRLIDRHVCVVTQGTGSFSVGAWVRFGRDWRGAQVGPCSASWPRSVLLFPAPSMLFVVMRQGDKPFLQFGDATKPFGLVSDSFHCDLRVAVRPAPPAASSNLTVLSRVSLRPLCRTRLLWDRV